jgi:hypothetical protein
MVILCHSKTSSSPLSSEAAAAPTPLTVVLEGEATDKLLRVALRKRSFIDQIVTCGPGDGSKFYVHKLVMSVHSR